MSSGQFLCLSLLFLLEGPHHPIITSAEATPLPFPSLSGFQPPEVDGSAVDFPCSILPGSTAEPPVTADQPDHAQVTTAAPITMDQQQDTAQQVTVAPKTPADVQSTPRKTTTERTAAPIRRQPAAEAPITNGIGTPGSLLLYYLLANQNNGAPGGSSSESSESNELYRSALGRAWHQRNQQPHYPSYYQPTYHSHYPSYHQPTYHSRYPSYPYRYPSHSRRQTVASLSSEEFGR